ncbi:MAG: hypothetical protein ACI376_07500 [Candidatus Bruticola sp.]
MTLSNGTRPMTERIPVVAVMRRILKKQETPITVKELTALVIDAWGRDFPQNPYADCCLVYKLAVGILNCQEKYDNLPNGAPIFLEREQADSDPIMVNPRMGMNTLNEIADEVGEIMLVYKERF